MTATRYPYSVLYFSISRKQKLPESGQLCLVPTVSAYGRFYGSFEFHFPDFGIKLYECIHQQNLSFAVITAYWDSAECVIYSTDYYQRLTLESWFTNLEQTLLNRCQQLPAPYKRLINDTKTDKQ